MKIKFFVKVILIVFYSLSYSQERVELAQLFLGIVGVGENEVVYHCIEAVGPVWVKNDSNYIISNNPAVYYSCAYSIGNFHPNIPASRASFDWIWNGQSNNVGSWGLGLYKVTNSKFPNKFFYLDTRNNVYTDTSVNPDLWFVYYNNSGKYQSKIKSDGLEIENGSIIRVSDILNINYRTDRLQNFWNNALVAIPSQDQLSPRIIWGPVSNFNPTGYQIYWRLGESGNFGLLNSVDKNIYDYTHEGLALGRRMVSEYKVRAFNNNSFSDFTNIASIQVSGYLYKSFKSQPEFELSQNYPNPFNPITRINYTIPEKSFVNLKVYDAIGNEVATLVNEIKDAGNYSLIFNAQHLSSGLYFYTLKTDGKSITRKMILIK